MVVLGDARPALHQRLNLLHLGLGETCVSDNYVIYGHVMKG